MGGKRRPEQGARAGLEGAVEMLERTRLLDDAERFERAWHALREGAAEIGVPELHAPGCCSAPNIDGVDASSRRHRSVPRWWCDQPPEEEASMEEVCIIGIDLAKRSFQLHGARSDGSVAFRRKVSREKLLHFLAALPRCVLAMEACASAHHWGREIMQLGHDVRLIPPIYVKPFVKRQKNDAADAEAICEAAQRPTMRFVVLLSFHLRVAPARSRE